MGRNGNLILGDLPPEAQRKLAPDVERDRSACIHEWEILPANGPTSTGTCRKCGEEREFRNSSDDLAEQGKAGRPMQFTALRAKREGKVAKKGTVSKHKEIERRWPEIKRTIEEAGSINRAREKLGISYDAVRQAAIRHGMDLGPYTLGQGRREPRVRETDSQAAKQKPPAASSDNVGDVLIGAGLVLIGSWLKSKERERNDR